VQQCSAARMPLQLARKMAQSVSGVLVLAILQALHLRSRKNEILRCRVQSQAVGVVAEHRVQVRRLACQKWRLLFVLPGQCGQCAKFLRVLSLRLETPPEREKKAKRSTSVETVK